MRVVSDTVPDGAPYFTNCGADWFVADADNDATPPTGARLHLGTFWLDAGDNTLYLNHYCPVYRAGECTWLHDTVDGSSTCDSSNANSVHIEGDGICVVRAD